MKAKELDMKILASLRENCRMSYREMAHEVGSNINTVAQRVKALEAEGYILGYFAHIDYEKIGYASSAIINARLDSPDSLSTDAINDILNIPETNSVYSINAPYGLTVALQSKSLGQLVGNISEIGKNRHIIDIKPDMVVSHILFFEDFNPLAHKKTQSGLSRKRKKPLSEQDCALLRELRNNANGPLREYSEKLKAPISTIKERIDRLETQGIIKKWVADLNFEKLGYQAYASYRINLNSNYLGNNRTVSAISEIPGLGSLCRVLGQYDFYAGMLVKNQEHANQVLESISAIEGIDKTEMHLSARVFKPSSRFNPLGSFRSGGAPDEN